MNSWIDNWRNNDWRNSHGEAVANTDLLLQARKLRNTILSVGMVEFIRIPRAWNHEATVECRQLLDEMEDMGWTNQ